MGTFRRVARLINAISITAAFIFVGGAAVGVATAIAASNSAGADTPNFVTTCDVPGIGNVQFPHHHTGLHSSAASERDQLWRVQLHLAGHGAVDHRLGHRY